MEQGARILQFIAAGGFAVLGLRAATTSFRRFGGRQRALGAALGLLGLLPVLSIVTGFAPSPWNEISSRAGIAVFGASGFALLLFRHRLIPLPRAVVPVMAGLTLVSTSLALGLGLSADGPTNALQQAAGLALTVAWVGCVAEPIIRFWRSARRRPAIQRARLRALSAGYLGILIVAVTSQPSDHHPTMLLAAQIVVLIVVPLLWVALMPPAWLRRSWQGRDVLSRSLLDALVRHREDKTALYSFGLKAARALVGGDGGAIVNGQGHVLAAESIDLDTAVALARAALDEETIVRIGDGAAVIVPMTTGGADERLIVTSGPFSPLFGLHELNETARFASTLAIALDRVGVVDQHRSQSEHYAGVVGAMSDLGEGFLVTDGRRLVHANEAYCRITGYTLDELRALDSLADLAPQDELEKLAQRRQSRLNGGPVIEHYDSALIRKDGRRVELEVSMKILGTTQAPSIVCIVRDVTDRKRAEERLRAALEREHEAVRRLEALDEMKNAFLSAVSHELRTPLTGVVGFARTLRVHGESFTPSERADVTERLMSNADKLERLLTDLLDLDRLSRGIIQPKRRPIDLAALVRGVVREFKSSTDRNVVFDLEPVVADVDRAQIERVVENLLINAARHTDDGTPIWARVRDEDGAAVVVVEDAGPGIPDDMRDAIFEPFRQGPSLRAHSPGVGIGLSLVRRFVDLHEGSITVGARPGGGASFRITLPAASAGRPPADVVEPSPAHGAVRNAG